MGYSPERRDVSDGVVLLIDYAVPRGERRGRKIRLGIQVPVEYNDAYPHFVHLPADVTLPRAGNQASDIPGYQKWSRPPKDRWADNNATMQWYVKRHLRRLWEEQCYDE